MAANEQQIRIASKLYEIRATMRSLFGVKYPGIVAPYKQMLERVIEMTGLDALAAAGYVAKRVDPTDGAEIMKIMAAAVELIDPSPVSET